MAADGGGDAGSNLFDRYDTTAVLVPGAVLLIGLWVLWGKALPPPADHFELKDFSLGAFGVFAIAAYCAGHLIQAPAELVTQWVWARFGSPGENVRTKLATAQSANIAAKLKTLLNIDVSTVTTHADWRSVTLQMGALLAASGRSSRLLTFNANFGLFRGLTLVFLALAVYAFFAGAPSYGIVSAVLAFLAVIGMVSFAQSYARELWNQFLAMTPQAVAPRPPDDAFTA
jgi:hypothetical protein